MCGIFGAIVRNSRLSLDLLERATNSLAHRGPDDSGTVVVRDTTAEPLEIGLGNTRLAILDLSNLGHQPMQDQETGNWIVYNGEIYNFREVRRKLEKEGTRFASHSDTEVLLKAYGRWGERCLHELRGMFAFGIWDARHHRLFMARDPMGIKPLYYYARDPYFLFASEVRTLLGTGLVPRQLDQSGLLNYLDFGSVYDPNTLIEGVKALQSGHYLVWEKGQTREVMYWDLATGEQGRTSTEPITSIPTERDKKKLGDELRAALEESVRLQLVSDVPVGVFLSGGIDSSSLVALLSHSGVRLNTFSLVFREAGFSEAAYSRAIAEKFGTEHQEILVSQQEVLDLLPGAIRAMDQPTSDGINTYFVARQARAAGLKVALSGLGGDEMFAGYSSFRTVPRMERFVHHWQHVPRTLRLPLATAFALSTAKTDRNRKLALLARHNGSLPHPYFLSRMLFTAFQRDRLFLTSDEHAVDRANATLRNTLSRTHALDSVNRVSYLESRCYMLNTLLRDADFMSMAHGLEIRVPLIDHRLAERMFAIPGCWKLNDNVPKPLLVGALQGALPDRIVRRTKRGFTLPFEHWLKTELRSVVEAGIQRVRMGPLASVMDSSAARGVLTDFLKGRTSWSRPWAIYVLQRWCELHL
jgi:asparagine synthase (glutamine-hydrolysing)